MKLKLILLIVISSFIIYITYNHNYKKTINITSINSLYEKDNYNKYMSSLLSKSELSYNYNIDYSNDKLEIENILTKINNNEHEIQVLLHKSNAIILSLGNIDYKDEELKVIIDELNELFKKIRLINNKEIYYVSPPNFKNTTYIKEICHKYNIIFINGASFQNKPELLAQILYKKIESSYLS